MLKRLLLACLVAYAWVVHPWASWNADSHLALTYAIVDGHTLSIDAYAEGFGDKAMVDGHYYTDKFPAESFLAVPAYASLRTVLPPVSAERDLEAIFVRYVLTWLVVGVPSALGVALLWRELVRLGARQETASLAALAYGLGSLMWPFATLYFSHALAATCVLATWIWARRGQSRALVPAALGVCCEAPVVVVVAPALLLAAGLWWKERRQVELRPLLGSLALASVPVLLTAAYATAVYGAPWKLGYEHLAGPEEFRTGMAAGLLGIGLPRPDVLWAMLALPYRGLLVANPVVLVALPAAVHAIRRRLLWEGAMLATFAAFLVLMSGYAFWDGGASLGPRHVISALPLVFVASGRLFRGPLLHALTGGSILLMLLAVAASAVIRAEIANPWLEVIFPAAFGQRPLDNSWPYLLLGIDSMWSFLPVAALIAWAWPWPRLALAAPTRVFAARPSVR